MQFVTQIAFKRWERDAAPGEQFVYYEGEGLMRDRQFKPDLDRLATLVRNTSTVDLLQRPKPGSRVDFYYIARKKSDFVQTANPQVSGRALPISSTGPTHRPHS